MKAGWKIFWSLVIGVPIALFVVWGLWDNERLFLVTLLNGLTLASLYFIVAAGFTLVFGLMDVLNFGHGVFIALGAFVATSVFGLMGDWTASGEMWRNFVAVLPAMLVAAPFFPRPDLTSRTAWLVVAYQAFLGAVAHVGWYEGVKTVGPSRAAIFLNLQPIVGVLLAWVMLGETIAWPEAAGGQWAKFCDTVASSTGTPWSRMMRTISSRLRR